MKTTTLESSERLDALSNRSLEQEVRAEQVRLLYRNAPVGILVNVANTIITLVVLWGQIPQHTLLIWVAFMLLVVLGRSTLLFAYRRAPEVASDQPHWSILFSIGAACAGAGWGVLGLFSPVYLNLPYQAFVAFVVGGMAIGGIAVNASLMPSFLAFLLATVVPLDLWFFWQGTPTYIAMGMLGLVFIAALYQLGRNLNESILRSIRLSIEYTRLANTIRSVHQSVVPRQRQPADAMKAHRPLTDPLHRHEQLSAILFPSSAIDTEEPSDIDTLLTDNTQRPLPAVVPPVDVQAHAAAILQFMACAVVTTDIRGRIHYMNPFAEVLTGWAKHEARNQPLAAVFTMVCEHTGKPITSAMALGTETHQALNLPQYSLLISKSGKEHGVQVATAPLRSRTGHTTGFVLVLNDVTEMRRARHQLLHQATHDELTGLVNRREFERRLSNAVSSAQAYGAQHALCYMDLDHFKIVNDTAGHEAGDTLLKQIAARLMGKIRMRDTLARIGGDEFGLLVEGCPLNKAYEITQALISAVRAFRFCWDDHVFEVGISIGVVAITPDKPRITELLSRGDSACYTAKRLGGNQTYLHHTENSPAGACAIEGIRFSDIAQALKYGRLRLYYQPIVSLDTQDKSLNMHEILLRLADPTSQVVLPNAFLPLAKRYGLMSTIDRWVIQTVFQKCAAGPATTPHLQIAINLSDSALKDDSLPRFICDQMARSRLRPWQVCFEISETTAIQNLQQTTDFILTLKQYGYQFALDDFGSGLSSLAHLKKLHFDYLKIDRRLIQQIVDDSRDGALVAGLNALGHRLGMRTVSDWAETETVVEHLRKVGLDYVQGYAVSPPRPLEHGVIDHST